MMLSDRSDSSTVEPVAAKSDPFIENIKKMIDIGLVAREQATAIKSLVIKEVQNHSAEVARFNGDVSDLFLDLCDLMVSGKLSKMSDETFKAYIVVRTYSCTGEKNRLMNMSAIKEMTGIPEDSALADALQTLKNDGYIDSVEEPIVKKRLKPSKTRDEGAEKVIG